MRMTVRQLQVYSSHMPTIEASEAIAASSVSAYPHMTEEGRINTMSSWRQRAGLDPLKLADLYEKGSIADVKKSAHAG